MAVSGQTILPIVDRAFLADEVVEFCLICELISEFDQIRPIHLVKPFFCPETAMSRASRFAVTLIYPTILGRT